MQQNLFGSGGADGYDDLIVESEQSSFTVVMFAVRSVVVAGRWLVASMVCALVAHAALYHSSLPDDRLHAYFAWYAPLVAGASACSVIAIVVGGLVPGGGAARLVAVLLPRRSTRVETRTVGSLALGALAVLIAQESLERSVDSGALTLATFDVSSLPLLVAVLGLCAAAVLTVGRTVVVLSDAVAGERRAHRWLNPVLRGPGRSADLPWTTAPLGRHAALRAPPIVI